MLDLKPVLPVLFALVSAMVTAAIPFVVPLLRRALGWHITAAQAAIIDAAVKRGAGVAAQAIAAVPLPAAPIPLRNAAVASGVEYEEKDLPRSFRNMNLEPKSPRKGLSLVKGS